MLLNLMALMSSVILVASAISEAYGKHVGLGGYLLVITIGLLLAVANVWAINKAARLLANVTGSFSERQQEWAGKAFFLIWLIWFAGMGAVGYCTASVALRVAILKQG